MEKAHDPGGDGEGGEEEALREDLEWSHLSVLCAVSFGLECGALNTDGPLPIRATKTIKVV